MNINPRQRLHCQDSQHTHKFPEKDLAAPAQSHLSCSHDPKKSVLTILRMEYLSLTKHEPSALSQKYICTISSMGLSCLRLIYCGTNVHLKLEKIFLKKQCLTDLIQSRDSGYEKGYVPYLRYHDI